MEPEHDDQATPAAAELLDRPALARWLDEQGLEPGLDLDVELLVGGASNVMFRLARGASTWVLRRPAAVALDRADEGMRREFRFLRALEGTDVPHPAPVALCDDAAVLGCTFYLMAVVDGVPALPPPPALDGPEGRRALTHALVDALARLHAVDPTAAGIADLGRPEGFHERQVARWTRQLESYRGRSLDGIDRVAAWLDAHRPGPFTPSIMHGDYHMLNVLVAPDAPARVLAIVDWETATIGDPLLDLAGFCEIWPTDEADGWPSRAELVARYADTRGLPGVGDLTYHVVLYNFRFAVLLEGIYQRSLLDPSRPDQDMLGERALVNVARALALVDGGSLDAPTPT